MRPKYLLAVLCLLPAPAVPAADEVPPEAQKMIERFEQEAAEIRRKADLEIKQRRDRLLESLQALHADYLKAGKAAEAKALRARIDEITGKAVAVEARPDPGDLGGFRADVGKVFHFEVTGNKSGPVWGDGIYTDDSRLATAAVHAGVLKDGEKGVIKVTILAGQNAYTGAERNGVTSSEYGAWEGSYRVEAVKE